MLSILGPGRSPRGQYRAYHRGVIETGGQPLEGSILNRVGIATFYCFIVRTDVRLFSLIRNIVLSSFIF